jgi:hypothetical protein
MSGDDEEQHDLCLLPDVISETGIGGSCSMFGGEQNCIQGFGGES